MIHIDILLQSALVANKSGSDGRRLERELREVKKIRVIFRGDEKTTWVI